ncbi:MAG TPA: MFS transporter, partial [Conexibacter sp.]|nr:MFS transporter [Conexibacter sp.]
REAAAGASASLPRAPLPRESVREAVRASGRYVAASPALRTVLLRAALFVLFASAIWALLPAVADDGLGLGSGGYGLLLGCVGAGAVGGATLLPRLRARLTPDQLLAAGSLAVAVTALLMATVDSTPAVAAGLVLAGVGWIAVLATLSSGFQTMLPAWAKARGMAVYLVVFQGGMAIGSALVGIATAATGVDSVLLVAAVALAVGPLVALRFPFPQIAAAELTPACDWPLPSVVGYGAAATAEDAAAGSDAAAARAGAAGPVLVTVEYRAAEGQADALLVALAGVRRARRRTGAISWRIWRDAAAPERVLEQFVVGSWDEHLRQHARFTTRDQARLDAVRALTDPAAPPLVTHWTSAAARPARGTSPGS